MTELKPCPCCGGRVELVKETERSGRIVCKSCNLTMETSDCRPVDFLQEVWNKRSEHTCRITDIRETFAHGAIRQIYFLSCGHLITKKIGERFKYCEECGARVVME